MVKVFVAEDHAVVRDAVLRLLADDPRIEVLGDASDFSKTIMNAHKFRPDVLILDLHMPLGPGLSCSNLSRELNSTGTKILGISFATDEEAKLMAQSMGALELLDKINLGRELIPAILRLAFANQFPPPTPGAEPRDASELQ